MNILLFLPGLLVLLFQYRGVRGTVEGVSIIGLIQVRIFLSTHLRLTDHAYSQLLLPAPFFLSATNLDLGRAYFTSAFDFSRQFLYEWTVNWRFITEDTFHSREFATALLGSQVSRLPVLGIPADCMIYKGTPTGAVRRYEMVANTWWDVANPQEWFEIA
jgi:alpha-1,3-mannosyltransferase